jgi:hypothetical protein
VTGIKVLKEVDLSTSSQDPAPKELIPEVEDEEETPTSSGLPSASSLPLSNPLEQD